MQTRQLLLEQLGQLYRRLGDFKSLLTYTDTTRRPRMTASHIYILYGKYGSSLQVACTGQHLRVSYGIDLVNGIAKLQLHTYVHF